MELDSVDVLLEPALLLELPDKADRLVSGTRAELGNNIDQRAPDVFRHAFGVAADIDMCAVRKPCPQFAADLAHAILHIEFLGAVARPGERQACEQAR